MRFSFFTGHIIHISRLSLIMLALVCLGPGNGQGATVPVFTEKEFQVVVTGVEGPMKENVEATLAIPQGMIREGKVEPTWARRFARQAPARIAKALEPFGYYAPRISTQLERVDNGYYLLRADIMPGEPVIVSSLVITLHGEGENEGRLLRQVETFPLQKGAPLQHQLYEEGKGKLLATATTLGYPDAHYLQHEIRVDSGKRQADIKLQLDTGPKYLFGDITFHGADDYPTTVLKRYLTFAAGDTYDTGELAKTQANLLDADKFRHVKISDSRDPSSSQSVPISIVLEPLPRYQLRPGIGYGTDTGARTSLRFKDNNSFHLGHEFQADLLLAEMRQSLSGQYLVPLTSKADTLMAFSVLYDRDHNDTFDSSSLSTEASITHGLPKEIKTTFFISLSQENYEVGNEPSQNTTLIMPGLRIGQRQWKFEKPGKVRRGYAWQVEVRGSSVTLGSDVSVLQGILGGSAVVSLPGELKLILRAEGGTTIQDEFDDLPPSMRFFAGGDQSVRGYAYKSLGPKDAQGDVIGGRHLMIGSAEVEMPINDDWSLALFYDTGNAFDSVNDYELAHGAGLGIRRHTPIGPIKLDIARQLEGDRDYRLHLSVGFGW